MVEFFKRREAMDELRGMPKQLVQADIAAWKRVNPGTRRAARATSWIYQHYAAHLRPQLEAASVRCEQILAELLINVALVRNTLSTAVRVSLRDGKFPWLRLDGTRIVNLTELHMFSWRCRLAIFGTHVNPMRKHSESPELGYVNLLQDLTAFAERAAQIMSSFWGLRDPQKLLDTLMTISGYGGTGFRAKELLCDILDNVGMFIKDADELAVVLRRYEHVAVIGVGLVKAAQRAQSVRNW